MSGNINGPELTASLEQLRYLVFEGAKGADGHSLRVGADGHVYAWDDDAQDYVDTGFEIQGVPGPQGVGGVSPAVSVEAITGGHRVTITDANGTRSFDVMDGADGQDGQDGNDGSDGAPGIPGAAGVGIRSIAKTGTAGLVDTYTITLSNGVTETFTVTNGRDGSGGSSDLALLTEDVNTGAVFHDGDTITGAQINALAASGKAVFLWDVAAGRLYAYSAPTATSGALFVSPQKNGRRTKTVPFNDYMPVSALEPLIPDPTVADNDKVLGVSGGAYALVPASSGSGAADVVVITIEDDGGMRLDGSAVTGEDVNGYLAAGKTVIGLWDGISPGKMIPMLAETDGYTGVFFRSAPTTVSSGAHGYYVGGEQGSYDVLQMSEVTIFPRVVAADNGKFLRVVNGAAAWQTVPAAEGVSF